MLILVGQSKDGDITIELQSDEPENDLVFDVAGKIMVGFFSAIAPITNQQAKEIAAKLIEIAES